MKTLEHDSEFLRYLAVYPDGYNENQSYPVIILLHGFGSYMGDLSVLAPAINQDNYIYIFPNALIPIQVNPMFTGYGWTSPGNFNDPQELQYIRNLLHEFITEIQGKFNVRPGNAILGGFSQGGVMSYLCALAKPEIFGGVIALSSTLPSLTEIKDKLPETRTQPIFIAHGTHDEVIEIERGRNSKLFLESQGYKPVYKEDPMGHEIIPSVIRDLSTWLQTIMPLSIR